MARAVLIVMDSFGIGGAPDAQAFGDSGANTLASIMQGQPDLHLPNLARFGLFHALSLASGVKAPKHMPARLHGFHGAASEVSRGKDTPSGHWEIAGLPVSFDWGYFAATQPAFPDDLLATIYRDAGLAGSLGNRHASGTEIIRALGEDHLRTGWPIFYTSVDSVFQIAAHEEAFGLERLYALCQTVKRHTDPLNIGRVIARPFIGDRADSFTRTGNRRDFAIPPNGETLLDRITANGGQVLAVGKIGDIFAHRGVTSVIKASGNQAVGEATLAALDQAGDGDLVFSNFVDFDMLFGHRRDVAGYAAALEAFDAWLPSLTKALRKDDLMIITADHGCDPSWKGTDHTRERVPVLGILPGQPTVSIGVRESFADLAQTISAHLSYGPMKHGQSFLGAITHA
jgi:phosphopentomutase